MDLDNPEWSDVNIVTGCLKLYLRELPDPLLPFRMYRPFLDAASESNTLRYTTLHKLHHIDVATVSIIPYITLHYATLH